MSIILLWAASRPVSILPDNNKVSPGCQVNTSVGVRASKFTFLAPALASHAMSGYSSRRGGVCKLGPVPLSTKCACLVAAQLGIMHTGNEAA